MMKHVMCDLETLATDDRAIIISIGLVAFDLDKGVLGEELYLELGVNALKEQLARGRVLSLDTMCWWNQQTDVARKVWGPNDDLKIRCKTNYNALDKLDIYFSKVADVAFDLDFREHKENIAFWGNGATFDNVILRSYYKTFDRQCPWHYSKDFCYRTMKAMFANRAKVTRVGTHHNALDDAKTQAMHLIEIIKRLK